MAVALRRVSPAEFRAWRIAHGWYPRDVAARLQYQPNTVRCWDNGRSAVPTSVVAYMTTHPAPVPTPGYPEDRYGLHQAIQQWPTQRAWFEWWGTTRTSLHRWLTGHAHLPLQLRAWLRAGAPPDWDRKGVCASQDRRYDPARVPAGMVRGWRKARGWTQVRMAQHLGVSVSSVWQWEHDRGGPPWLAERLAREPAVTTTSPGAGWIWITGQEWLPPAGYCDPLRDALKLPGCQQCGYRQDCIEMFGGRPA